VDWLGTGLGQIRLGVIIPCHNDAPYLKRSLASVKRSSLPFDSRVLVVIDRCTDDSLRVAESFGAETLVKERTSWGNSTAENLNLGFLRLLDLDYVGVIAADTVVPWNYFEECVKVLESSLELTSVSGVTFTEPTTLFNSFQAAYELLLEKIGLRHGIRGSGRVYRTSSLRRLYNRTGTIVSDLLAEDIFLDEMLGGERRVLENLESLGIRRTGAAKSIRGQFTSGMARRQLRLSAKRVIGELPRLRFIVIIGFILYPLVRDPRAEQIVSAKGGRRS